MTRWHITIHGTQGNAVEFDCETGMPITTAARNAGIRLRASCKSGGCGICGAVLTEGGVEYASPVSQAKLDGCAPGTAFLCRATPTQDCRFTADWQWTVIDHAPLSRRVATSRQGI